MTSVEQRLIDAARVRAECNDRYAKAQDAVAMNVREDDAVRVSATEAAERAYQAVLDSVCGGVSRDFGAARASRDRAKDACRAAEAVYQHALQALSENPA